MYDWGCLNMDILWMVQKRKLAHRLLVHKKATTGLLLEEHCPRQDPASRFHGRVYLLFMAEDPVLE